MAFQELSLLAGAQLHGGTESLDQVLRLEAGFHPRHGPPAHHL